ncbi:hypothetical protein [Cecembia sp.]|uniref:hypothetical protein n=1 Tax=Cecembia sp. TaxID=1898110 RepID=UPI0025BBFE18|nr:hypothetical protein [Cecembia sp.]
MGDSSLPAILRDRQFLAQNDGSGNLSMVFRERQNEPSTKYHSLPRASGYQIGFQEMKEMLHQLLTKQLKRDNLSLNFK